MTNPKPHTLPVLRHGHVMAIERAIPNLGSERRFLHEIEAVVRALVLGTHEIQERVSGDTVRVPREELEELARWVSSYPTKALSVCVPLETVSRWLSGDKP